MAMRSTGYLAAFPRSQDLEFASGRNVMCLLELSRRSQCVAHVRMRGGTVIAYDYSDPWKCRNNYSRDSSLDGLDKGPYALVRPIRHRLSGSALGVNPSKDGRAGPHPWPKHEHGHSLRTASRGLPRTCWPAGGYKVTAY